MNHGPLGMIASVLPMGYADPNVKTALETALETTLTQKLRIRPLIIEAPNFQQNSRTPNSNSIL